MPCWVATWGLLLVWRVRGGCLSWMSDSRVGLLVEKAVGGAGVNEDGLVVSGRGLCVRIKR